MDSLQFSVVIPLFNEEAILESNVLTLSQHLDTIVGHGRWQFILVDNGSTDQTPKIIDRILDKYPLSISVHEPTPNYGRALRTGLTRARTPYVHLCDIEQWDIPFLAWAWALRDKHDLFIGSRRSDPTISRQPRIRYILSWGLNTLIQFYFGYMGTDTHGPKLINFAKLRPLIESCVSDRGQYDTEIVLRAVRAGFRIAEAPIAHSEKRPPRFVLVKKIGWNLVAFYRLHKTLRHVPYGEAVHFHQYSRSDVLDAYARSTTLAVANDHR